MREARLSLELSRMRRGLSLMEVATAGAVFSAMLGLILGIWPIFARSSRKNLVRSGAIFLANQTTDPLVLLGNPVPAMRTFDLTAYFDSLRANGPPFSGESIPGP